MTEQLKRYIFHAGEFRVHQDGDWVDFSDHIAAVAAMEKVISIVEEQRNAALARLAEVEGERYEQYHP